MYIYVLRIFVYVMNTYILRIFMNVLETQIIHMILLMVKKIDKHTTFHDRFCVKNIIRSVKLITNFYSFYYYYYYYYIYYYYYREVTQTNTFTLNFFLSATLNCRFYNLVWLTTLINLSTLLPHFFPKELIRFYSWTTVVRKGHLVWPWL